MNYYRQDRAPSTLHAIDKTSKLSDDNHPLNHTPLLLYNVGLEIKRHRWYLLVGTVFVVLLSSLIAEILMRFVYYYV